MAPRALENEICKVREIRARSLERKDAFNCKTT
jgi:hypothetical protein